jgi:hypothetical protein
MSETTETNHTIFGFWLNGTPSNLLFQWHLILLSIFQIFFKIYVKMTFFNQCMFRFRMSRIKIDFGN